MKHYLHSTFTTIALLFLASGAWAQFSGSGAGTVANPYIITTARHLDEVHSFLTAHFKLGNDIDLTTYIANSSGTSSTSAGWMPIGDDNLSTNNFRGVFDGNGHTISGLSINRPSLDYVGLFGAVGAGGTIKNVIVKIVSTGVTGKNTVGGLIGKSSGTIESVGVNINNTGVKGGSSVGGLIGLNNNSGIIENCFVTGPVTGTANRIGGLVGNNIGSIKNCYYTGLIAGTGTGKGGLVGENGILGKITACFFNNNETNLPGVGLNNGTGTAAGLSAVFMKMSAYYLNAGWDFVGTWGIAETSSYPFLLFRPSVTLTFNSQGGSSVAAITTKSGFAIAAPTVPTRSGYTFVGWYTAATGGTQVTFPTTITANTTIYARWSSGATTYSVIFNSQGGSAVATQTVTSGAKATTPSPPTRSGYIFGGWYREATCINAWVFATDIVTSNITLYAKWSSTTILYNVTIPSVTGIATLPASGTRTVANGSDFVFELWPLTGYHINNLAISTNRGNTIVTAFLSSTPGSERLQVTIKSITTATTIIITGVTPVSNEPSPSATRVWGYGSKAYFSLAEPTEVSIYTVNGMLYDRRTMPAGDSSIQLPAGLYIIRTNNKTETKIIIN